MSFFEELKRRNVFRVGIAYAVAAWLLIQISDTVFPRIGLSDSAVTLVIALLAIGFVPTLISAWAFEMTPEGLKRESEVDRSQSITGNTGKKLDRVIIVGLILVIVAMGIERYWFANQPTATPSGIKEASDQVAATDAAQTESAAPNGQPGAPRESVAVLPFTAMSSGEDDEYFADGLTEEILNSLAQLPELLVTARTSSFHFKGQNLPMQEIAATLGVANVVEGSVRRAGDRVRITAQLIRAGDGFHLWSETYDRTLEDVFAVQEDIAANIAETLDVVLDEAKLERMRKAGIRDVDAFIAYQKGQEAFVQAHGEMRDITVNLAVANRYFDQALAAAPDLIGARILKADAASHDLFDLVTEVRPPAYPGEAGDVLEALRKEFRLAWESSSPGNQRDILDVEVNIFADSWKGLSARMDRALVPDLAECPESNWTLEVSNALGKGQQVIDKLRAELPCNPYNLIGNFALGFVLMWNGEPDAALAHIERTEAKGLSFSWMDDVVAFALLAKGEFDDPRIGRIGGTRSWISFPKEIIILAAKGDIDKAREMARSYLAGEDVDTWSAANVAAIVGDREAANRYAARIDAQPGGQLILANLIHVCACGAPFDLDTTPNFKRRMAEGGFDWPPHTAIHFPAKDW